MVFYTVSFMLYMLHVAFQGKKSVHSFGYLATTSTILGLISHTMGFVLRWYASYELGYGRIPLTNMYESMIFFTWSIIAIYLIIEFRYGYRWIGIIASLLAALGIALTSIIGLSREITPLVPALKSHWLTIHVITCFLGYAAFAIGCGVSILLLLGHYGKRWNRSFRFLPPATLLDDVNYKTIAIGFPMLTLGIFTGAVWADYAWGTYWSWDPKETWSLITWFVYAIFLHLRLTRGWRGVKSALLSIIGFLFVMFTYWGVNYLLSGLHSYA